MKQLFYKIIYNGQINFFLRHINKLAKNIFNINFQLLPSGTITIKLESNRLKVRTNQTCYVTHLVFWKGYKNFEYTNIFLSLVPKIDCFFDIGANIGYYSMLASIKNPNLRIVSFEPAKGPLHYLYENINLNNFNNVQIEPIALSNSNGMITFYEQINKKYKYLNHILGGEGNTGSKTEEGKFIKDNVKSITFNQYVNDNNISKIDLVKMDTEGTENLILEKADYILSELKPIIICETLFKRIEDKLEDIMLKYGYEFYNHTGEGLIKVDSIRRETDNDVRNCFFVPKSKLYLIKEFVI